MAERQVWRSLLRRKGEEGDAWTTVPHQADGVTACEGDC